MLKASAFLLLLFLIVLATTFIPLGSVDAQKEMEIYLLSNEIHTDIVVPTKNDVFDWETFLNTNDFKARSEWIEFGWGDRQFYFEMPTWDKFTWRLAFDALFLPDPAVMHVNYLNGHPRDYKSARRILISFETYLKLVKSIQKSFKLKEGKPILIPNQGYSSSDNFYEAHGSFSLIRTCNVWTSDILAEVGLKHPLWSATKYGLEFIWREKAP